MKSLLWGPWTATGVGTRVSSVSVSSFYLLSLLMPSLWGINFLCLCVCYSAPVGSHQDSESLWSLGHTGVLGCGPYPWQTLQWPPLAKRGKAGGNAGWWWGTVAVPGVRSWGTGVKISKSGEAHQLGGAQRLYANEKRYICLKQLYFYLLGKLGCYI